MILTRQGSKLIILPLFVSVDQNKTFCQEKFSHVFVLIKVADKNWTPLGLRVGGELAPGPHQRKYG